MSPSPSKTYKGHLVALVVGLALLFALMQHWDYQEQNPGVEAKFMTRAKVTWRASTDKPAQPLIVVKRMYYNHYYASWVYEVRQGPTSYCALEIELDTYYP